MIKNSEGKIWHFRKGLIDFSGNVIKSVFGIISVSYTHLDVYKRQVWHCWSFQ